MLIEGREYLFDKKYKKNLKAPLSVIINIFFKLNNRFKELLCSKINVKLVSASGLDFNFINLYYHIQRQLA